MRAYVRANGEVSLRDTVHRWKNHVWEYLREGSQEFGMKASDDIHLLPPRNFKT